MIKAIFLDIDNTLLSFNSYVRHTMEQGFAHFGLKPYEPYMYDIFHEENNALWRRIEEGTLTFQELEKIRWNNIFQRLAIRFDGVVFEKYFREALNQSAIAEDGAAALLEFLYGKYILCVASNGPYLQQMNRLVIADMKRYFDYFFISEQIGASKPSKEFFDTVFRLLNQNRIEKIMPEETLMIGDSLSSDIGGGKAYGMQTCYYHLGACDGSANEAADAIVNHLAEIPALHFFA